MLDFIKEGVVEIVSYVMHEMKWEAVKQEVESRLSGPMSNVSDRRLYEAILEAFSDSWRDRDLYVRFSK